MKDTVDKLAQYYARKNPKLRNFALKAASFWYYTTSEFDPSLTESQKYESCKRFFDLPPRYYPDVLAPDIYYLELKNIIKEVKRL